MESILAGIKGMATYIDDIFVFGQTKEEHDKTVREVLERLEKFDVRLRLSKCIFDVEEIEFYGYILTRHGVNPKKDKIEKVSKWRNPISKNKYSQLSSTSILLIFSIFTLHSFL